jgi:hypothetical protein
VTLVSSTEWEWGEAGFVEQSGPGVVSDRSGNASLAPQRRRVAAAPGDFIIPLASGLSVSPRRMCVNRGPLCRRVGMNVRFTSSEAGRARFTVLRVNRRLGTRTYEAVRGLNNVLFDGRVRGNKLRPRTYRLLVFVEDAVGNVTEEPPITTFSVKRSKPAPKRKPARRRR